MGTRAWYEIYTVNQATGEVELAMQFRRSGDAFPGAALEELELLEKLVCTLGGEFPVAPLEGLLERSVGAGRAHLPRTFATGCFVFLLLQAAEDVARPRQLLDGLRPGIPAWRCAHFDEVLRQRIRRYGPITAPHPDPIVSRANRSIETAAHVHTWALSSTRRSFLDWIHRFSQQGPPRSTQYSAGPTRRMDDITYLYRFFLHIPDYATPQPISHIGLQWCDERGKDLLAERKRILTRCAAEGYDPDAAEGSDPDAAEGSDPRFEDGEYDSYLYGGWDSVAEFDGDITALGNRRTSLRRVRAGRPVVVAPIWRDRVPRGSYVGA